MRGRLKRATLDSILASIAAGSSAVQALAKHGVHPAKFYALCDADEAIADRYARAMQAGADAMADDTIAIADGVKADAAEVAKARLRVDARKWWLAKRFSGRYGDRMTVAGDASAPVEINLSADERTARLTAILDAARTRRDGSVAGDSAGTAAADLDPESGAADGMPEKQS